jgi:hypothetical protein
MRCKGSTFFLFRQKKKEKIWKNKQEKAKNSIFPQNKPKNEQKRAVFLYSLQ